MVANKLPPTALSKHVTLGAHRLRDPGVAEGPIHRRYWPPKCELRTEVFEYIEVLYNR